MIKIEFHPEEIEKLDYERRYHSHPRVRQKMEVLYFKAMGLPHGEIVRLCHITRATLARYLKEYQEGGICKLRELSFRRPMSEMMNYREEIIRSFNECPPATVNEARARIEQETQLKRSPAAVRRFMNNLGMHRCKVGMIPSKADPIEQNIFVKQQLEPRLKEMESGQREIFL